jgi:hypothetical protein
MKIYTIYTTCTQLQPIINNILFEIYVSSPQNHDIKTAENVAQFRYLGMTISNPNLIHEKIKRRLNSGNASYHSVQNLLSS